jgi:hypothetical protein
MLHSMIYTLYNPNLVYLMVIKPICSFLSLDTFSLELVGFASQIVCLDRLERDVIVDLAWSW